MEGDVFPIEAVASLMKQQVVESRLHTDLKGSLTDEQLARNRALQDKIADGNTANPYFVIVDAQTGNVIEKFGLTGHYYGWPDLWIQFIKSAAKKAGRKL